MATEKTTSAAFPFLTTYDPEGASEGRLDPLGLYQIADQLAVQLVPAVRERMLRIRLLTAMAVGALVTEGLDADPARPDAAPYLVWEWLIVEAIVRQSADERAIWGVPGRHMARRALERYDCLDARSYLKTPRIFGLHGIYKRLAIRLGLVNEQLAAGPNTAALVDAWAGDRDPGEFTGKAASIGRWQRAVRRSLAEPAPRTKTGWSALEWADLAQSFSPGRCGRRERGYLRGLLLAVDQPLGTLPAMWPLLPEFTDDDFSEERLHERLERERPEYEPLLRAIRRYEAFARSLQDAFDVLRAVAGGRDAQGFAIAEIARDEEFTHSIDGLHERFETAAEALGGVPLIGPSLQPLFRERFALFALPLGADRDGEAATRAFALCEHHANVQRRKSAEGKRCWFDRLAPDRIYIRHAYRDPRQPMQPGRYVHDYRGWPARRFWSDLR